MQGKDMLAALVQQAAGRISVMGAGGVNSDNILRLARTGMHEFHSSAKRCVLLMLVSLTMFVSNSNCSKKHNGLAVLLSLTAGLLVRHDASRTVESRMAHRALLSMCSTKAPADWEWSVADAGTVRNLVMALQAWSGAMAGSG